MLDGRCQTVAIGPTGASEINNFDPGAIWYFAEGFGHAIRNIGDQDLEMVQVWDSGRFEQIQLDKMVRSNPAYLLASNFAGAPPEIAARLKRN